MKEMKTEAAPGNKNRTAKTTAASPDNTRKRQAKSPEKDNSANKTETKRGTGSKTAARSSKKSKQTADAAKSSSGSRTAQVMKLVEPQGNMVNPVIIAGKSRIPKALRGQAPLSKIMRREAAEIFGEALYTDPNELLTVNLTELVIKENAGELLRRFNACCCDRCIEELSRRASDKIPSRFIRVTRAVLEQDSPELNEQKEPLKKSALSAMIRELIGNKRRHFHNQ